VNAQDRILFVTGRLAEPSLRRILSGLSAGAGAEEEGDFDVAVLGVSVAALLHTDLVARRLKPPAETSRIVLPGWCGGDLGELSDRLGIPVDRGPKDLYDLPAYLSGDTTQRAPVALDEYSIEILAEINHAPRLSTDVLLAEADRLREAGADVIDLGMVPGESWGEVGPVTARLVDAGHRVSIDSFDRYEVTQSIEAGAEWVLSCDSSNVSWLAPLAAEHGAGVVVVPRPDDGLEALDPLLDTLGSLEVRYRIDPVLAPIGMGFATSLERYFEARRRWPAAEMMMGTGNVTELTEVDSAGVNVVLAAICQELRIGSVLTTEVINWCRTSVAELDVARRLVHHSLARGVLPKHLGSGLVMLRDMALGGESGSELERLAEALTDPNFRVFVEHGGPEGGMLHVMNRDGHWRHTDPFELFDTAVDASGVDLSPAHAFYLGYELAKARTALTLGKRYVQDDALRWGALTREETSALHRRRNAGGNA